MISHRHLVAALPLFALACSDREPAEPSPAYFDAPQVQAGLVPILGVLEDSVLVAIRRSGHRIADVIASARAAQPTTVGTLPAALLGRRFELPSESEAAEYVEAAAPASDPESVEFVLYATAVEDYTLMVPLRPLGVYRLRPGDPLILTIEHSTDTLMEAAPSFQRESLAQPATLLISDVLDPPGGPPITLVHADTFQSIGHRTGFKLELGLPPGPLTFERRHQSGIASDDISVVLVIGEDRISLTHGSGDKVSHYYANGVELLRGGDTLPGIDLSDDEVRALSAFGTAAGRGGETFPILAEPLRRLADPDYGL